MFKGKKNSSHKSLGVNGLYRAKKVILLIIALLAMSATASAATYYLDANNGNDSNNGSINSPWRTMGKATALGGGNTVIVANGHYGTLRDNKARGDWLTIRAASGAKPQLYSINVGPGILNWGDKGPWATTDVRLRVDGFIVTAPVGFNDYIVKSIGGNYFEILNSTIAGSPNPAGYNKGYWDIDRSGVLVVANHTKIHRCDISNVKRGIELKQIGYPNVNHVEEITNNYIHDCSNTGIFIFEQARVKIEYNHIYRQHPYKNPENPQHGSGIGLITAYATIRYNIIHSWGNSGGITYFTKSPWDGVNTNAIIENNLLYDSGGMSIAGIKSGCKINNNTVIGHADANQTSMPGNERRYVYGNIRMRFNGSYVGDLECYNNLVLGLMVNNTGAKINAGNNITWDYEFPSPWRYSNTSMPNSLIAHPNYNLLEHGMFVEDPIDFSWPADKVNLKYSNQLFQDFHLVEGAPAINFGSVAKQTLKGLGTIGPDGFIQDDGIVRDAFHHSTGAYEFGPAQPGAPRLDAIGDKAGNEDEMIAFTLTAADPEGDTLNFSSSPLPSGAILDTLAGDFAWIPSVGQTGQYEVTFTVSDGSQTDSKTTNITVYPKDVFAPEVTSVMATKNTVAVTFNEPVDPQSAKDIANYSITNGITISAANIDPKATVVVLTTSDHAEDVTYTLTASDISDTKNNTMNQMSKTYRYTNGLVGAWKFNVNNATSAEDLSGNGSTATIYGATWTGQNELSFDGLDDYVSCSSSADLNLTSSLTLSAWINPRTFGQANVGRIIDKGTSSTGFSLLVDGASAALKYVVYGKAVIASNSNVIDMNLWQHVAVTYDESAELVSFYVDGQPAGTAVCTTNPLDTAANPLYIGIRGYDYNRAFDGLIDDVRTFNRALTGAEMTGLYTDGKLLFDPIGDRTVNINETLTINVATSAPSVTVTAQPLPEGSVFADNTFEWTPATGQAGIYDVDFIATDGEIEDVETVTITVSSVNSPPVMAPVSNMTVNENTLVSFSVNASDPDGDSVTITGDNLPAGSDLTDGAFSWTPTADQIGDNIMSFVASDGQLEDVETVTITVTAKDVPQPEIGPLVGAWKFDVGNAGSVEDLSGNGSTATIHGATWTGQNELSFDGLNDYVNCGNSAALNLTSNLTISAWINPRTFGQANFGRIVDKGTSSTGFSLLIDGASGVLKYAVYGRAITASNPNVIDLNVWQHVVATYNDSADLVSFYVNGQPAGTAVCTTSPLDSSANPLYIGIRSYDKNRAFDGLIDDVRMFNKALTGTEIASLYNDHKALFDPIGNRTVNENETLTINVTASAASVTVTAQPLPAGATFAGNTLTWTPASDQAGTYSIDFTATDGRTESVETVTITVNNVNRPPVVDPISNKIADEGQAVSFDVTATDADGDALTLSAANLPQGASFTNGTFAWTPSDTQAGTYTVTFTATDGAASDSETVTITVNNVNRPPVMAPIGNMTVDEGQAVSFDVTATDADGDTLTLSAADLPQGASFTNAAFAWTPADGQAGTYTVTFTATDGTASDSESVTITVNANTNNGFAGAWRFNVNDATSIEDLSGNGSTATIHGATWNGRDELSFDGTNDYVNCGNSGDLNLTSSLTISAWINPRSFGQRNFGRIVDKGTSSTGFSLLVDGKSAALKYAVYGKAIVKSNPNVIDLNMWQHVAATYNESAELVSFYVNGQPAGTAVCTTNPLDSSANPLFIGIRGYDQSRAFDGIIDDVCTFSKALTSDEIAALHSTGVEVAIAYSVK